jgi:hypothetical protein
VKPVERPTAARFADSGYSGDRRQRDPGYAPFFGALISAS